MTIKEAAQCGLAFSGKPGEAKDKPRQVFERKLSSADGLYDEVFGEGVSAFQILLPIVLYQRVLEGIKITKEPPDWLSYARLHCVWLIGELVRTRYEVPESVPLSEARMKSLAEDVDTWFPYLFPIATQAIGNVIATLRKGEFRGLRELFRSSHHYPEFRESLNNTLEQWRVTARLQGGRDPLTVMP